MVNTTCFEVDHTHEYFICNNGAVITDAVGYSNWTIVPAVQVANHFNVHMKIIRHLRRKCANTGDVKDLPRSGQPKVTTPL